MKIDCPIASSSVYPNICRAPAFQVLIAPCKLFEMIASWEDSTMAACRNRSSCVVLLSLMSSTIATTSEEGRLFNSEILRRPQISEPSRRKKRLSS